MTTDADSWWVYLIKRNDGALYCGIAKDVMRRFREHVESGAKAAKALKGRGPLELVYYKNIGTHGDALREERRIKSLSPAAKRRLTQAH